MNKIEQTLNLYNSFKKDHDGDEPLFALVKTNFDETNPDRSYTIKLDWDKSKATDEDPDDEDVFFYANGMQELLAMLLPSDTHDFTITEVITFQSLEEFREGSVVWIVRMDWACDGDSGSDIVNGCVYKRFKDALACFNNTVAREKKTTWISDVDPEDGDYLIDEEIFGNGRERVFDAYLNNRYDELHTKITIEECEIY